MNTRVFLAFIILTTILSMALVYTYYVRRAIVNEGFAEEDIESAEEAVRGAIPQLDSASIANTLALIKRLSGKIMNPAFFTNAYRLSSMSPVELAREHIKAQKSEEK